MDSIEVEKMQIMAIRVTFSKEQGIPLEQEGELVMRMGQ